MVRSADKGCSCVALAGGWPQGELDGAPLCRKLVHLIKRKKGLDQAFSVRRKAQHIATLGLCHSAFPALLAVERLPDSQPSRRLAFRGHLGRPGSSGNIAASSPSSGAARTSSHENTLLMDVFGIRKVTYFAGESEQPPRNCRPCFTTSLDRHRVLSLAQAVIVQKSTTLVPMVLA